MISVNDPMNSRPFCRSPVDHAAISAASSNSFSQMKIIDDLNSNDCLSPDKHSHLLPQDSRSHTCAASPSISSIMSSMSFQTLTSFIPISWNSSQQSSTAPATLSLCHSTSSSVRKIPDAIPPRKFGYASRKKQLQLLKVQMELEGVGTMRTSVQCKKCDGDLVFI